jgi:hypothetical protein
MERGEAAELSTRGSLIDRSGGNVGSDKQSHQVEASVRYEPCPELASLYEDQYRTFSQLHPALKETFARQHALRMR